MSFLTTQHPISRAEMVWYPPIWMFYVKFRSQPWLKSHNVTHNFLTDASRKSIHLPHTSNEGYETLQQQLISFLTTQHPISHAEMVPPIWMFCVKFRSQPWLKSYNVTHWWLTYAFRSSSHPPYTFNEGYETLQQQ
jgi:hypothetical protein